LAIQNAETHQRWECIDKTLSYARADLHIANYPEFAEFSSVSNCFPLTKLLVERELSSIPSGQILHTNTRNIVRLSPTGTALMPTANYTCQQPNWAMSPSVVLIKSSACSIPSPTNSSSGSRKTNHGAALNQKQLRMFFLILSNQLNRIIGTAVVVAQNTDRIIGFVKHMQKNCNFTGRSG
jgi:hypothetical protein